MKSFWPDRFSVCILLVTLLWTALGGESNAPPPSKGFTAQILWLLVSFLGLLICALILDLLYRFVARLFKR